MYNLTTSFRVPDRCNRSLTAGKCVASVGFWYHSGEYFVSLEANPSSDISNIYNRRSVLVQFSSISSDLFIYSINRACTNQDNCARELIKDAVIDMLQRQLNYSAIMTEMKSLVIDPSAAPDHSNVTCYDSNQNVKQCGTSTSSGSCMIFDTISSEEITVQCDAPSIGREGRISIDQSDNDASFGVHCNRSLCNTRGTLQTAKEIAFRHRITVTADGRLEDSRLDGSRLIVSSSLVILMVSFLLFNRFECIL